MANQPPAANYDGDTSEELALPCHAKLAFDSQRQAAAAATVAAYQYGTQLKAYCCRYCGLWHLASA